MKNLLCIVSQAPYHDTHSLELIEAAMVGAVFDFKVSILFRGDGVWSLLKNQDAGALAQRTVSKILTALPTYEVDSIYVCSHSMNTRQLTDVDLVLPATSLEYDAQATLIAAQDAVMGAQA